MKIARVYYQEYPGRQVGDIHDVFSPDNHPGQLMSSHLKEVEVADDFDAAIYKGVIAEDGSITVEVDPAKQSAKIASQKQVQIAAAYAQMEKDIFDQMEVIFGTRRSDSAAAAERTLDLMTRKPELFAAEGLLADIAVDGFAKGAALNTEAKVTEYATKRITQIEAYGVFRLKKIKDFQVAKATIEAQ